MSLKPRIEGHFLVKAGAWLVAIAVIALPVIAIVNGWVGSGQWPFRQLRVDADFSKVNVDAVRAAVAPTLGPGFFAVDLGVSRDAVEKLPWVESAEVRKLWPDIVEVRVVAYTAVARWNDSALIDANGRSFVVPEHEVPTGLVRLSGPEDRAADVLALTRELSPQFEAAGLAVGAIRLSGRGSVQVELGDGRLIRLGRDRTSERLARFLGALSEAQPPRPGMEWQRADLRYSNGFALAWATPDVPTAEPPAQTPTEAPTDGEPTGNEQTLTGADT
jgi:cell division protein FtsQ